MVELHHYHAEQLRARASLLSCAADRVVSALQERDFPTVAAELPGLQTVLGRDIEGPLGEVVLTLRHAFEAVPASTRLELVDASLEDYEARDRCDGALYGAQRSLAFLVGGLESAEVLPVAERWFRFVGRYNTYSVWEPVIPLIQEYLARGGRLPAELVGVIRRTTAPQWFPGDALHALAATLTEPPLNPGEAWSDRVSTDLGSAPAKDADPGPWRRLVAHAATATTAKPSKAWQRAARSLFAEIGPETTRDRLVEWLAPAGRPRTVAMLQPQLNPQRPVTDNSADEYDPCNLDTLRGLTWLLGFTPASADSVRTLGHIVETSLRKLPGVGERCVKAATAGIQALSWHCGDEALAELTRLSVSVSSKAALKSIAKAVEARAAELGLSAEEVEELSIPTFGLTELGRRVQRFGAATAELTIAGTSVTWTWRNDTGRAVKSAPATVRNEHGPELKELKSAAADIAKTLSAHSERLDRQFLARRSWRYETWRARLADHLLLGTLVRRLIWLVDGVPVSFDGFGAGDELQSVDGATVTPRAQAPVELWHPVDRDPDEVMAWRLRIEQPGVSQPFKQAHREVYVLTPAEEATRVYSNRFAARLCRQYHFQALAAARGWHSKLRLPVDGVYPPAVKQLPLWDLRAEFWIDGARDGLGEDWLTSSCAYTYLSTDQIRFYRYGATTNTAFAGSGEYIPSDTDAGPAEPVPLAEIPPLVLSEILRDADLFVGVAGVANDPTWTDGGADGRYRGYWHDHAFGELGISASNRADLLTRLLPRLAIADRCRIEGRFLEVRGDLNTYKIHLGSGNILISPDNRYLCIVPGRKTKDADVTLPFEGDLTLAVILSKALLLADDTAIDDPAILPQLR